MNKIKIPKQEMLSILWDHKTAKGKIISGRIVSNSRWSILHEIIFTYNEKTYKANYSTGATEYQDESPWMYYDEVEATEVHQVEKLVKVWEVVNE